MKQIIQDSYHSFESKQKTENDSWSDRNPTTVTELHPPFWNMSDPVFEQKGC